MYRKALVSLSDWFEGDPRKPLLLRGARQVGKSTLVRLFAHERKLKLIEINLEKSKVKSFDSEDLQIQTILQEIEYKTGQAFSENCLLFIDEIQSVPNAIKSLRYFYEDRPDIPVIAAGSLLEFVLKDHQFSMPVGRIEYLHLGPMSFQEFLLALGHEKLVRDLSDMPIRTSLLAFEKLADLLREFYVVGGMPEAVKTFAEKKSFLAVHKVQSSIIDTYIDDFPKYSSATQTVNLGNLMRILPEHLGKKVKYSAILPEIRHTTIKNCLNLLEQSKVIIRCQHTNATSIPLIAQSDESVFKLYFLDIGLINYMRGISAEDILTGPSARLVTEGFMAEQFVAQNLQYHSWNSSSLPLFYWLRDKKKDAAEIDFLIQRSKQIIPVEVKSGKSGTLKSLHYFMVEKSLSKAIRLDLRVRKESEISETIRTKIFRGNISEKSHYQLLNLPLFLIEFLDQVLKDA